MYENFSVSSVSVLLLSFFLCLHVVTLPVPSLKKLESLTVEIGDYGFVDVESRIANTEIVKQVVNDVMKTTLSHPSWRN